MHSTVHKPQKSSPEVKISFYLPSINVVFPCVSIVHSLKKVLKLLTTGSEDCYYTGIEKNM